MDGKLYKAVVRMREALREAEALIAKSATPVSERNRVLREIEVALDAFHGAAYGSLATARTDDETPMPEVDDAPPVPSSGRVQ